MAISRFALLSCILAFLHAVVPAVALSLDFCSSTNTGASFDSVFDTFQSNGACHDTCVKKYAVAILQGKSCWCSNDVPGGTISNSACDETCPGYPSDSCGNSEKGLYAYILLGKPSRTIGPVTKTPVSATSQAGITMTVTSSQSGRVTSSSTETPTATDSKGKPTNSGPIVTHTVPPGAGQSEGANSHSGSSIGGGAIAGIVIGTLLAVGLIISAILWLFWTRRRREKDMKGDMQEYDRPSPSSNFQSTIQSPSMTYQRGPPMNGAMEPPDRNLLGVPGFTDSRMKKDAVIYPNGNRHSNVSLQDNQDYSRPVLRVCIS
ncbi:hypothetical protein AJ78_00692 [Emergomyces pasteurianus Ep9510]|uniref:WSC domain-containing protein n=1 Tax=Emergomyces pasteurianus Ep9510 TaxID=1447872 RepID=A0A1J9QVL6_9EURO|nr:hypothetical protein AJ78_00692 [Emergomyces pasteurianus Ep9510]